MSARTVGPMAGAWLVSRAVVLAVAVTQLSRPTLFNDPNLLWAWATGTPFGSDADPALAEYPGAARLLALSGRLASTPEAFGWAWIAAMLVVDAVILVLLTREGRRGGWFWIVGGAALGPVLWLRYDLVVGLLVVIAMTLRDRRPAWSGIALGVAVLLKLWPLVLVAALLARTGWRRWATVAAATVGAGALLELLTRGYESLLTPLTYQSDRGIQIESLVATPTLIARHGDDPMQVWEFAFRAFQLQDSDGTPTTIVGVVVLLAGGAAVLAGTQRCASDRLMVVRASGAALLAVLMVATNSVFSPQYVMWFLPLVALLVAHDRVDAGVGRAIAAATVLVAALTQVVWPWNYPDLLALQGWVLAVLTVRNLLVLVLVVLLVWRTWTLARPPAASAHPSMNESRT